MNINEMAVSHGDVASALIVIGAYGMPRQLLSRAVAKTDKFKF